MDFSSLIGIPYERCNCWELAVKFYLLCLNIELHGIYDDRHTPDRDATRNLVYSNIGEFDRVEKPQFGDIILLKIRNVESHISVYVGEGKMLHTSRTTGSIVERIERWKPLIVGYYRVKAKND